jgi:DNA-binding transcriptional LysR family regulator
MELMMDIRALRYFVEVVKRHSFTKAADALFVTQPTISKMVKQLEEELGTPLIIREGRSFRLSDAGKVAFERGMDVLSAMNQLKNELNDLAGLTRGELVVGLPPMVGVAFSPRWWGLSRTLPRHRAENGGRRCAGH